MTWLYCSEIAVDTSLGFVGTVGYFTTFCVSLSTQPLIDSSIGLIGTFILYGIFNIVSTIWCFAFMRETSGLTDLEKKSLYMPDDLQKIEVLRQEELMKKTVSSMASVRSGSLSSGDGGIEI